MRDSARMRWCGSSGKTGDREIKTSPEKMHWTAFAAETGTKFFQDAIGLQKNAPETIGCLRIVASMGLVLIKADRLSDLVRQKIDLHRQLELPQSLHYRAMKARDRLRG